MLVRWTNVKLDLNELARLRWIKKMTTDEICRVVGKRRSAVQESIRTIRNAGISQLNLTDLERIIVQEAIDQEIVEWTRSQPKFKLASVSPEFRKKAR